jgi:hypothetical protein
MPTAVDNPEPVDNALRRPTICYADTKGAEGHRGRTKNDDPRRGETGVA